LGDQLVRGGGPRRKLKRERGVEQPARYDAAALQHELGPALGRLLYFVHLAILLFWLLERSPGQRATQAMLALLRRGMPLAAASLRLPGVRDQLLTADAALRDGLRDTTSADCDRESVTSHEVEVP